MSARTVQQRAARHMCQEGGGDGGARTSSNRRGRRFPSGRLCAAVGARRSSLWFSVSRECGDCYGGAWRVGRIGWGGSGAVGRWNVYWSGVVYNLACSVSAVCYDPPTNQDAAWRFFPFE